MRQFKTSKDLGKDTHVRDHSQDIFRIENHSTFQVINGEIDSAQPEPIFSQNLVTVKMATGGKITSVAYPGAFIDPVTGNLHGTYEGPISGQQVMVGFENGNRNSPFVVNRYPYQGVGNTFNELKYKTPLTKASYNPTDVIIGHQSGSFLSFNTGAPIATNGIPGSVKLKAATDFLLDSGAEVILKSILSTDLQSAIVKLTGTTNVQLNGDTNFAVKYTELKTVVEELQNDLTTLKTAFSSWVVLPTDGGAALKTAATAWFGTAIAGDMTTTKNDKVLM